MAPSTFKKLQDRHVLVIGGTSGIGYAVAEGALADGARVTVASSTQARIDTAVRTLAAEYGPAGAVQRVQGVRCDLASGDVEARLEALFVAAVAGHGGRPVDHVVYTAANGLAIGPLADVTRDSILAGAQMRMFVPILLAKVAQRHLPKASTSSLTFTSGQATELPPPDWSVVVFFTGGTEALTKGLAIDMAPVRVNTVLPGLVKTDLWKFLPDEQRDQFFADMEKRLPVGAMGRPEDVAEAYLWLMKDRFVTGSMAHTNGGALII
ncbi:oxidoreductase, short chain dehydrogenase/reductase family [Sporothrix schenckii 1099-18]|uniref:Uncharacterized protein n=2 Tax=Sporothrix schenckii TaxID=29908 RepID=U7PUV8_SPOS1|nr:oxidoreductase, short chain dehydrogenase/reductase family [Sporothrix schenckii 1099-18]ERS98270.1 hypothetical protein HMPREF1624_05053 [Sporothrix schenckii ATCC 58251]KJR89620.1 oxidoreductase, short chain dehydrogenase/reductase family [Sporothrix schenckii 1099-18]